MERRRRSADEVEGDREARSIALALGRVVRDARRRRRLTQAQLGAAVGLRRSRISEIEGGLATGTPLVVWVRLGMVLQRPLAMAFSRDLEPVLPADAGHLAGQELVLRLARRTGRPGQVELPTRPEDPSLSVDVCLRDDRNRTLVLNEIWNRFDDFGRAARSTDRKIAEARELSSVSATSDRTAWPRVGSSSTAPPTGPWSPGTRRSSRHAFRARRVRGSGP